ncbi:MAG: hypothetical protein IBJ10_07335 [Phycisphaerales bacterium]|nr:hypothetical protein [Phycisphaerales bacterium]
MTEHDKDTPSDHARGPSRRESVVDRRSGVDRRNHPDADATGLERRRGPGRRLSDFMRAAEEGELNREQFLFVQAIEAFKRVNNKTFPSWTDVLEVIRLLGYRKTMSSELSLPAAEDWSEAADAPSNVKSARREKTDEELMGEDED